MKRLDGSLTSIVHFASITVGSQIVDKNPLLLSLFSLDWPSLFFSIDILVWDVFLASCLSF